MSLRVHNLVSIEEPAANKGSSTAGQILPSLLVGFLPYKSQITWKRCVNVIILALKRSQMRHRKSK